MYCLPSVAREKITDSVSRYFSDSKLRELFEKSFETVRKIIQTDDLRREINYLRIKIIQPYNNLNIGDYPEDIHDSDLDIGRHIFCIIYVKKQKGRYLLSYNWPNDW